MKIISNQFSLLNLVTVGVIMFVLSAFTVFPDDVFAGSVPIIENQTSSNIYINDFTFSHVGTGSDLLAVVLVAHRYGAPGGIEGVTYGGQEMTLAQSTNYGLAYVYYLENAPEGQQAVNVNVLNAAYLANRPVLATALTITGADLDNAINSTEAYSGEFDNSIETTINTTGENSLILSVLGTTSGTDPSPLGEGHISIQDGIYNFGIYGFGYKEAEYSGPYTLGWSTTNQGNDFGLALVEISSSNTVIDNYPLYTQVTSTYPSLEETSAWANDTYAYGAPSWCGTTIAGCGCAITSAIMSGRNAGILEDVLGDDVNPENINNYLTSIGGYTEDGSVFWTAVQSYLGEFNSEGKLSSRFKYLNTYQGPSTMSSVDSYLSTVGTHALLAYKSSKGHFVWLPEKTESGYVVRDPKWYETKIANDSTGLSSTTNYSNSFDSVRVFEILEEPEVYSGDKVETYLKGTAELLYKDLVGNKVGYSEGSIVIDLERASYGNTEVISLNGAPAGLNGGKHLLVPEASNIFTLEVVGTEYGPFELEFFSIDENGEVVTFDFSGTTTAGIATTFTFNLETGEVTESEITYDQFLEILDTQLAGVTLQQQKFFKKWAEKIFEDMEDKTVSKAIKSIETYKKLLIAKKVDGPVLSNVLDLLASDLEKVR